MRSALEEPRSTPSSLDSSETHSTYEADAQRTTRRASTGSRLTRVPPPRPWQPKSAPPRLRSERYCCASYNSDRCLHPAALCTQISRHWPHCCAGTGADNPATDATGHIHDRSPVILPASFWEHWLDPSITDRDEVQAMVNSIPEPHLQPYQVSTAVNNVENDRPELLNPVGEDEK
ncbi:hypothetical protein GS532_05665 [Rhodococcus hoagii]|nr:hypothetical protein [Prescottella equi]